MNRTRVRTQLSVRSRRRRAAAVLGIAVAGALLMGPVASASGDHGREAPPPGHYVVRAGDTLWGIARRAEPGRDPRPLIQAIEAVNGLRAGDLVPGRTLLIPLAP
ncbi:MAG: LysM peptidoglycan-binding domain-containing protein [Actinomycetota bacterium]|nr:LysM peptidoglycan-binding domain-containing protein [Actinomycetota bacterium]